MSKKQLSKELAAALHSGAVIDPAVLAAASDDSDADAEAAKLKLEADAAAAKLKLETDAAAEKTRLEALAAAGDADAKTKLEADAAAELAAADAAKTKLENKAAKSDGKKALITHLQTELNTLRGTQSDAATKLALLTTQHETIKAENVALNAVVQSATTKLCVALNVSPALVETLKGATLCETYNKLSGDLTKKFKVGAVSDTGAEVEEPKSGKTAIANPMRNAGVRAASGLRAASK